MSWYMLHHSSNRKDEQTSALEVYPIPANAPVYRRLLPYLLWYVGIAFGGWFLHSLVSILFFLFLPLRVAQKVSPAFQGWTRRDQIKSIFAFVLPMLVHLAIGWQVGPATWAYFYGLPFVVFAWVYSIQLYVYHYATSIGPKTVFHARRLTDSNLISWWLLNLNSHDTHHRRPKVVWYKLPEAASPLPSEFSHNQNVNSFSAGILQQFKGPKVIET